MRISREGYEDCTVMNGVRKTQHFIECKTRLRTRIRYVFRRIIGMSSDKTNKQYVEKGNIKMKEAYLPK